jgi:Zn-dependent peptidase ImmA (M78 family)
LFEYLTSSGSALVNSSHSCRQKRNRAFAAEFLAPATAIKERLPADLADEETVASLARHVGVSEYVIHHQIVLRSVCEPLGAAYREQVAQSDNDTAAARNWLLESSANDRARAARGNSQLSGTEHQRI